MDDHTEAELAKFEAWWEREGQYRRAGGGGYEKTFAHAAWFAALNRRATQASAPADLVVALDRMDALLDPAAGLLAVPDDSATAKASRRDMALIRAHLRAPATRANPSPVDATASLIDAARAVVDRWHTPAWKEVEHTAAFIARLDEAVTRAAGAAPQAQHVGWVRVAERLPEKEQEVLILFHPYGNPSNKARVLEAVHTDGGFYDWDDGLELHHPTHWMPKPALQGAAPQHQGGGNG